MALKLNDKVESVCGTTGVIIGFGGPRVATWAMVRSDQGDQSFGLHILILSPELDAYGLPVRRAA
jgi:hypothetical protein